MSHLNNLVVKKKMILPNALNIVQQIWSTLDYNHGYKTQFWTWCWPKLKP